MSRRSLRVRRSRSINEFDDGSIIGEVNDVRGEEDNLPSSASEAEGQDANNEDGKKKEIEESDNIEEQSDEENNENESIRKPNADDDDEEDDEEDGEDNDENDDDDDDDDEVRAEYASTQRRRGRGRPPGSKNKATLAREMALGIIPSKGRRSGRTGTFDDEDDEDAAASDTPVRKRRPGRQPGVKMGKFPKAVKGGRRRDEGIPINEATGEPYLIVNDELDATVIPEGENKINEFGILQGGREFRVRTFTVSGRGDRLYMLSTEPARCMGFRDSYLLFQKHRMLHKVIVNDAEKFDLIERDLIPHSYKGRAIGVVTARSVFREFGAKIIVGGKHIIDDYNEEASRNQGLVEGQLADPNDRLPPAGVPYNKNQYVAWHGASSVYHQYNQQPAIREVIKDTFFKRKQVVVTDENWMLEHASATREYNRLILEKRKLALANGAVYEPHIGLNVVPSSTQPTKASWEKLPKINLRSINQDEGRSLFKRPKVVVDTVLRLPNIFTRTGLKNVPSEIFQDVSPEIKEAILAQQKLEMEWDGL
ncbi:hypothetical protein NADFUDRAFT_84012 [Nadsonia fulvescens var. elongata DSM 6958]|uniref:Chromatin structure-remodeling complex protein RSC7 n=1 Tax=Nadsonia fulvescens var. elongata DSM 6958 TaxID=857566 RepID=A0A1E3PEW3_9ASCO|nr:hypothetical protein NADFUDRAFT_84012 [Nadsonia fulvescens var. elongata DSM 6958]